MSRPMRGRLALPRQQETRSSRHGTTAALLRLSRGADSYRSASNRYSNAYDSNSGATGGVPSALFFRMNRQFR